MFEGAPPPTSAAPALIPLRALLDDWDRTARDLYEARAQGAARGPVTGLKRLDAEIGGALAPGVHVAHGVPGVGKTAFALQMAGSCGCPCLYVTCEMPPLELLRRITARVTGTFLGKLKSGELHPDAMARLVRDAIARTPDLALLDATTGYASPEQVLTAGEATRRIRGEGDGGGDAPHPHLLVVVDSLHAWAAGGGADAPEYERLAAHLHALKGVAARLACPVLTISERNRQSMERGGLSAGAGHRGIEYGAETVFDLDCDRDAPAAAAHSGGGGGVDVTLRIQKNRHGAPGARLPLIFHGALQQFREAD